MPWRESRPKAVAPRAAAHARSLRRALTEPEKRLWWHLRHRLPLDGTHFRRQVPIGSYLADFCCLRSRLIVEVDGGPHGTDPALAYDARRTAYLVSQGYQVLRFANHEVTRSIDVVLAGATPTPGPSPQGGGESARPASGSARPSVTSLDLEPQP